MLSNVLFYRSIFFIVLFFSCLFPNITLLHASIATSTDVSSETVTASTIDPIQQQMDTSNAQIAQLKREIEQLQSNLIGVSKQKKTLQGAVSELSLNIKKLTKNTELTNIRINQKDVEIHKLSGNIMTTSDEMTHLQVGVSDSIRQLRMLDDEPFLMSLVQGGTLSSFFDTMTTMNSLRTGLEQKITTLNELKTTLISSKTTAQQKRTELASLKQNLAQQKRSVAIVRDAQTQLLKDTKNKESDYQALIAQKQAQEAQFEQDLLSYASQLSLQIGVVPSAMVGILQWPVDVVRITQYFGNTAFATQNPQVYGNKGHNAIDFGISLGTPIRAARGGVILGTGNTDLACKYASYGKWIFIKHDNGLSTLYAHLSVINVSSGQTVGMGQVIGYSGSTGYATGPHLHFGVYASSGSQITSFPSKSCKGKMFNIPLVGNAKAYLNPLSYLPSR